MLNWHRCKPTMKNSTTAKEDKTVPQGGTPKNFKGLAKRVSKTLKGLLNMGLLNMGLLSGTPKRDS